MAIQNSRPYLRRAIVAGMKRSGSTWVYNSVRFCFINAGYKTYGDYIDKYRESTEADVHVVKIHPFDRQLLQDAHRVFTTIRDIRDVAASLVRRGLICNREPDILQAVRNVLFKEYGSWQPFADIEIRYEDMILDREGTVASILKLLGIQTVDPAEVVRDVGKLNKVVFPGRERISQLWPNHITDGRPNSYRETLNSRVISAIEVEFGSWLELHQYEVG